MKSMTLEQAEKEALTVSVFLEGGGQENIGLPESFIPEVAKGLKSKGYERLKLSDGRDLKIHGILIASHRFYDTERVIMVGVKEEAN
jgi:hypothetical protein